MEAPSGAAGDGVVRREASAEWPGRSAGPTETVG